MYKKRVLIVEDEEMQDSILTLWAQEPSFSNASGTIEFAGGLHNGGFQGRGKILTITFKPKAWGKVIIDIFHARILAHDGKGTDILKEKSGASYLVRDRGLPSPDLNDDGSINIHDLSTLISHWDRTDSPRYDLNKDGEVNLRDFSILLSMF